MIHTLTFRLLLAISLLQSTMTLRAQLSFDWAVTQGGNDSDLTGTSKIDYQGDIYVSVSYRDTTDLDPGPGVDMVFVAEDEIFVLNKFNPQGEYMWGGQFKTAGNATGYIAEVKNNRILLIIYYTDYLIYTHDTPWSGGQAGSQVAAISMNLDGQIISIKHLVNNLELYFSDFLTQPDGSILASGGFEGSVTFSSPDSTMTIGSNGSTDAFLAKFNADLEVLWITVLGSPGYDFMEKIFVSQDGRIYYAMIFDSTLTIQTNQGPVICPTHNNEDNAVFGWAESDGTIETAYLFGGDLGDQLREITVDEAGNIYICGYIEGAVNFQHPSGTPVVFTSLNDSDGFVAKYTTDGELVWARIFPDEDYGGVYTMKLHRNTHLYLSGNYTLRTDLDPGPDSMIVNGGHRGDSFISKMDTDGNQEWVYSFVGNDFQGIRNVIPGPDGKLLVHGYYFDSLDCNPGLDQYMIASQGGSDVFLVGFTEQGVVTSASAPATTSMSVYPNPALDYIDINAEDPIEYVEMFTLNGTTVIRRKGENEKRMMVNVSDLSAGTYALKIKTANHFCVQKLIITD